MDCGGYWGLGCRVLGALVGDIIHIGLTCRVRRTIDHDSPMASTTDNTAMPIHVFTVGLDRLISPWSNSTQINVPATASKRLVADMIELTRQYGRYGYRRVAALLRDAGWQINDKRVERLWRREGLKVPMKQPKKGRLWLNDGSCIRLRPEYRNHV